MAELCSVPNCTRETSGRKTLCDAHHKRLWRTGDVLADIPIRKERRTLENPVDILGMRECQDCVTWKPLDEYHRDKKSPGGRRKTCKACRVAIETARYQANPEAGARKIREFRAKNLAHVREREAAYYDKHREKRIETAIKYSHQRRARIKQAGCDTGITVPALRKIHGEQCCYCKVQLIFVRGLAKGERPDNLATLEHKQPIARGGSHTWDNCTLACWRCNISKGAKSEAEFIEFMQSQVTR